MNFWKKAFFILLGLIFIGVIFFFFALFGLMSPKSMEEINLESPESIHFNIEFTNQELENLIKLQLEEKNVPMTMKIEDQIRMEVKIPIFSMTVPINIRGDVSATKEGYIDIDIVDILGEGLSLPKNVVLMAMDQRIKEPFLQIQANNNKIRINPSEFSKDFKLKAKEIDLRENKIIFESAVGKEVFSPTKNPLLI